MGTKNIEVVELKRTDKQVASDELGNLGTPGKDEVGGRTATQRYGQCQNCGFIAPYTERGCHSMAQCANCGAVLTE